MLLLAEQAANSLALSSCPTCSDTCTHCSKAENPVLQMVSSSLRPAWVAHFHAHLGIRICVVSPLQTSLGPFPASALGCRQTLFDPLWWPA